MDIEVMMIDEPVNGADIGLLESLRHFSTSKAVISYREFQRLLAQENREMALRDWHEVVTFASEQFSQWQAQWLFSPSTSPDTQAFEELEGWRQMYDGCLEPLIKHAPNVREGIGREHRLRSLRCTIERRIEKNQGRPFDRYLSSLLGKGAILLAGVGLRHAGNRLYAVALFPKGTVGRSGCERVAN
jgi:hypothetical protein